MINARKIKVYISRSHRACNPVSLGQSRGGFILAALLVACWQLSAPAQADVASEGFSCRGFLRLEWDYSLGSGTGTIRLLPWGLDDYFTPVLEHGRFTTAGLTFDSVEDDCWYSDIYGPPTYVGEEEGRSLFEYDFTDAVGLGSDNLSGVAIAVTFPTQGVELRATEFEYEGYWLSGTPGLVHRIPPGDMPFVTIQTIPEPAAAVSLGLAAAALAATRRRQGEA